MRALSRSFYDRDTRVVARELLGKYIIRKYRNKDLIARIVETEAYLERDPASHAYKGITPRCAPMFEHPGHAYVYFIYGFHNCLNFVTESNGKAGAVLIRAVEPVKNINLATNGPGRLTKALKIDRKLNRADLTKGVLIVAGGKKAKFRVIKAKRIGLSKASDKKYRYYIKDDPYISAK
jgi:DNA-3-methyladenine glycosylase